MCLICLHFNSSMGVLLLFSTDYLKLFCWYIDKGEEIFRITRCPSKEKSIPFPHTSCKQIAVGKTYGIFLCYSGTNGLVTHDIKNSQQILSSNLETVENLFGISLFKSDFTQMLGGSSSA